MTTIEGDRHAMMDTYNATLKAHGAVPFLLPTAASYRPAYLIERPELVHGVSDVLSALIVPVVVYWLASAFFHLLDYLRLPFIEQHRLHEPEEVTRRNKVTLPEVVKAVVIQHILQTALGYWWLDEDEALPTWADHDAAMATYAAYIARFTMLLLGPKTGSSVLRRYGTEATRVAYWWAVPALQFVWSFFLLDTWQYFWHRALHVNKWAYRHIHARHHRLYVPYACGALYNHPLEGFILDTLGSLVAHTGAGLTTRMALVLFGVSTLKTVDDHCGLALPWDPLQFLFGNNADYHDIHHQQFGIKKNFSQPYFIHWDAVLGTRMTRDQAPKRSHTDKRDPIAHRPKVAAAAAPTGKKVD